MAYDPTFHARVFPALMRAFDTALGPTFDGRIYATVAPDKPTMPYCVYNSNDGGGVDASYIGMPGWQGDIVFRSTHTTASGAWNYLVETTENFQSITASGYTISYKLQNPQWFPVERSSANTTVHTAGIVVTFRVHQANDA